MSKKGYLGAVMLALLLCLGVTLAQENAKVAGKWEMSWQGRQGNTVTATLNFTKQDGEKLEGTLLPSQGPQGQPPAEAPVTGTIKGNKITFTVKRSTPRGDFTTEYNGTVEGDNMKGTATIGMGEQSRTIDWTAKRMK
jgi:hypothetical protein